MSLNNIKNPGNPVSFSGSPKSQKTTKRVADIILNSEHPLYDGPHSIGTIFFTDEKIGEKTINPSNLPTAKPLNINNYITPLIGELVQIIESVSDDYYDDLGGKSTYTTNYYTANINVHNNAGSNALPLDTRKEEKRKTNESEPTFLIEKEFRSYSRETASKKLDNYLRSLNFSSGINSAGAPTYKLFQTSNGEYIYRLDDSEENRVKLGQYYEEDEGQKSITSTEGSSIIQGRNGQRINLMVTGPNGSNSVSNNVTDDPTDGNPNIGDKAMVLSLGSGEYENITADAASVYMGENLNIPLDPASTNIDSLNSTYEPILDPLDTISTIPAEPIASPEQPRELQVQSFNFNLTGSEVVSELNESPEPTEVDPYDDPVFDALDEAHSEGLLTYVQSDENYEVAGTELSDEEEQWNNERDNEDPDNPPSNITNEDFIPNLNGMRFINNREEMLSWIKNGNGRADYPITIKGNKNGSYPVIIDPRPVADIIQRLKDENINADNSNLDRIKHLICHITATSYRDQVSIAKCFLYDKGAKYYSLDDYNTDPGKRQNNVVEIVNASQGTLKLADGTLVEENQWVPRTGGWSRHGYHFTVDDEGLVNYNVDLVNGAKFSNGCAKNAYENYLPSTDFGPVTNLNSINISWIGNEGGPLARPDIKGQIGTIKECNITAKQAYAYQQLILYFTEAFPNIKVAGHNQITIKRGRGKACPTWNNAHLCELLNVSDSQIFTKFPSDISNSDYYTLVEGTPGCNQATKNRVREIAGNYNGRVLQNFNTYKEGRFYKNAEYVYAITHPNEYT
jgi:hypothetical protein